jgi:hypothetical protein
MPNLFRVLGTAAPELCVAVAVIWPLPKVLTQFNSAKTGTPSRPADRPLCPTNGFRPRSFVDFRCLLSRIRGRQSRPLRSACLMHLQCIHAQDHHHKTLSFFPIFQKRSSTFHSILFRTFSADLPTTPCWPRATNLK